MQEDNIIKYQFYQRLKQSALTHQKCIHCASNVQQKKTLTLFIRTNRR